MERISRRQAVTAAGATVASLAATGTLLGQEKEAKSIKKGQKIQIAQEATYLGALEGKETEQKADAKTNLLSTAAVLLINCRADRLVRGYSVNQGIVVTLPAAIPQTCPGDSDAQIAACAAQRKWVPLGNLPAGRSITVDLVSTRPGDDSTIYVQTIIRDETLDAGDTYAVPFVRSQ